MVIQRITVSACKYRVSMWRYLRDSQTLHDSHKFSKMFTKFWIRIKRKDESHRCTVDTNNCCICGNFVILDSLLLLHDILPCNISWTVLNVDPPLVLSTLHRYTPPSYAWTLGICTTRLWSVCRAWLGRGNTFTIRPRSFSSTLSQKYFSRGWELIKVSNNSTCI